MFKREYRLVNNHALVHLGDVSSCVWTDLVHVCQQSHLMHTWTKHNIPTRCERKKTPLFIWKPPSRHRYDVDGCLLTEVTDVVPELLEDVTQAFRIGGDLWGIHHKDHTVHLVLQQRLLHITHRLRPHWLFWAELQCRHESVFVWLGWDGLNPYYTVQTGFMGFYLRIQWSPSIDSHSFGT